MYLYQLYILCVRVHELVCVGLCARSFGTVCVCLNINGLRIGEIYSPVLTKTMTPSLCHVVRVPTGFSSSDEGHNGTKEAFPSSVIFKIPAGNGFLLFYLI